MNDYLGPIDAEVRAAALDPARSFCVTAPAGSGKTELLSQRVLRLLATVAQPEEVLAITFTRKAAAEMQQRILAALRLAAVEPEPAEPHRRLTWQLARAALQQSAAQGWQLLDNPARLRVLTIDGLCASLVRQLPVLSAQGGQPRVAERPELCYQAAVDALLEQLEQPGPVGDALAELLRHLDVSVERLQRLLLALLARRDQWLPLIGLGVGDAARAQLEAVLQQVQREALLRARLRFLSYAGDLLPLLDFAATQLAEHDPDHALTALAGAVELPAADSTAVADWYALADWLLTKDGGWRKQVTVRQGFPPGADRDEKERNKQRKQAMSALLAQLALEPDLADELDQLRRLPAATYDDGQWRILAQLTALLPYAAAQLEVAFQQRGEVDFTAISLAALAALGDDSAPGELLLRLDERIRHLLVDEFQDTSSTQFRLLERLVTGWTEHNEQGHAPQTLFIVGDGMQSIYGFREANVGLFLGARRRGVNGLPLTDAPLQVNFRSTPTVVGWVNRVFATAFPAVEHIARGAVSYEVSHAFKRDEAGSEVAVWGVRDDAGRSGEADWCVALVQRALAADPAGSIAVLVRNRPHLAAIVPALARAGIRWRAADIDPLAQRAAVQDLLALLKALLNPADRISWLALLRSPLVGLDHRDLHALAAGDEGEGLGRTLWTRLRDAAVLATLSAQAQERLANVIAVLEQAQASRARKPIRSWLEGVWLALGGPLTLADDSEWRDLRVLLDLLEQLPASADPLQVEQRLGQLYARAEPSPDARVTLMTVHKSKGLEFDTVIIPGLDRAPRSDDKPLLLWHETLDATGAPALLLAAAPASAGGDDPIYAYLADERKRKQQLEDTRLLYVAATRAVRNLHLVFADVSDRADDEAWAGPGAGSLLARIWPAVVDEVRWREAGLVAAPVAATAAPATLRRVPADWRLAKVAAPAATEPAPVPTAASATKPLPFAQADLFAAPAPPPISTPVPVEAQPEEPASIADTLETRIGTVIHGLLEQLVKLGWDGWNARTPARKTQLAEQLLRQTGVAPDQLDVAAAAVVQALDSALADPRGRWLLSPHAESVAEWELQWLQAPGRSRRLVIDRSFVDEQGVRWIVDYKSSLPRAGESLAAFGAREALAYRPQLEIYRELVRALEQRPLRLALYFPRVPHWVELD